jgi:DNA-binding NarL/FixJ family response regulator
MNKKTVTDEIKRIMIVDDHPLVREGLAGTIMTQPDMCVCGEAATASEAMQKIDAAKPDAIIIDLSLPGPNGMELIKDLQARYSALPKLVLSMHDEALYAERALRAGARGYLMKGEPTDKIIEALRTIMRGELYASSNILGRILQMALNGRSTDASPASFIKQLSDREIQVFEGIGNGLSTKELAKEYGISPKTVETYRSHIKHKLRLASNNDLIHTAVRWVEDEAAGGTVRPSGG